MGQRRKPARAREKGSRRNEREAKSDVAVVFVHGIGDQEQGTTGREGSQCLSLVLDDYRVEEVRDVSGTRLIEASARRRSRHVRARLTVIDGWWNDVVTVPGQPRARAWRVLGWIVRVAPMALLFNGALAAAGGMLRRERRHPGWSNRPVSQLAWLSVAVQSVLWRVVIAPPVLVVAAIVGAMILAVGPRSWAARASRALERVIGDAYAFCRDEASFAAMIDRTRLVLKLAKRHARRVVLVGHSQGAAIARAVCAEPNPVDALVTVGAGTQQLGALRRLRWWHTVLGWAVIAVYPGVIVLLLVTTLADLRVLAQVLVLAAAPMVVFAETGAIDPEASASFQAASRLMFELAMSPQTVVGIVWLGVGAVLYIAGRTMRTPAELMNPQVCRWHDVSSILDPVCPGGALVEEAATPVEVVNTHRVREALREHIKYLANPAVADVIVDAVEGDGVLHLARTTAERRSPGQRFLRKFSRWGWPVTAALTILAIAVWGAAVGVIADAVRGLP